MNAMTQRAAALQEGERRRCRPCEGHGQVLPELCGAPGASMTAPKRRRPGRPRIVPGEKTTGYTLRLTTSQRAKLERLGGAAWLRERIDQAPDKPAS